MHFFIIDMDTRDGGPLLQATDEDVLYSSVITGEKKLCNIRYALLLRESSYMDSVGTKLKEGDILAIVEVRRMPEKNFIVGRRLPKENDCVTLMYDASSDTFHFINSSGIVVSEEQIIKQYERIGNVHVEKFLSRPIA